jgi:hypothetical protein
MITTKDLLEWCLERKKEGKIFERWSEEALAYEIVTRMNKRELVVSVNGDKINGACLFHLEHDKQEVFVENIVSSEPNAIWPMFCKIIDLCKPLDLTGWNFTGIHRAGHKRKFIVTEKLYRRFSKI